MGRKKKALINDELEVKLLGLAPPTKVAAQHEKREYQQGWDYLRAEQQRQQIAITKPTAYKQVSLKKIAQKMPLTAPKKGLYAKAMETSTLQSATLPVYNADIERAKGINYTQHQENSDN